MAINFLYEEYKKDPVRVEKLLDKTLEISEKLDGSRFLVQNDEGNRLMYFKRRDIPISKIDRTLSKYFEKAIYHFENLSDDIVSQLPEGWRFGMEYFPNLQPVTITYDRLPLNNLVLTDIQVKDPKDRTVEVISDKDTLAKWAEIMEIENPPIIFEGKLSDTQRRRILDFLNTPYSDLISRFKTESFTSFILGLLNPELKTSFLNNDTEKDIDGLVFKFDGKEALRVSNPEIAIRKTERKEEKPSDIYNLTLVMLQEFLMSLDFKKIKLREKTFEERYIEFISQVYNKFLHTSMYAINFEKGVDFELPRFLTKAESEVNFNFVNDPETKIHLAKSNTNRELFKILMASLRSHKKKATGFFSKELIYHHNQIVDQVADYVGSNIKESEFYSFQEFKNVYLSESENWQEEFGKERLDEVENVEFLESPETFPTYSEIGSHVSPSEPLIKTNSALEVMKKLFADDNDAKPSKKKTTRVCIIKGKFQPFHNGHVSIIDDAEKATGLKVFLVVINKRLPKNRFSESLHKSILDEISSENDNIAGYIFSNGRSFSEVIDDLPNGIEASAYAGSTNECEDIKVQMGEDFVTIPLTRHINSTTIEQKIKNEDYNGYKKLVPKSLHNYFHKIKNELN